MSRQSPDAMSRLFYMVRTEIIAQATFQRNRYNFALSLRRSYVFHESM